MVLTGVLPTTVEVITKHSNFIPIYVFYNEMNKRKRNEALNAVVYNVYHSYHVVQSSLEPTNHKLKSRFCRHEQIDQKP